MTTKTEDNGTPALPLTDSEIQTLRSISAAREKLDLLLENTFLKASVRLKLDLTNYAVDMDQKMFVKIDPKPPAEATKKKKG